MKGSSLYIGLMSGTSLDGLDAALVDCTGAGLKLIDNHYQEFPDDLKNQLHLACQNDTVAFDTLATLDHRLGHFYADNVLRLLSDNALRADDIAAVGCHGQTLHHRPPSAGNERPGYSLQIGDPNIIAERTGITTVGDFRRRDIAAGGHGAPLAPAFHEAVLRSHEQTRVVVNIGGIANITVLPPQGPISGFDTGPGNGLMDAWARARFQQSRDHNGGRAAEGTLDTALLTQLLTDPYFRQPPPKSTGREYFNLDWLQTRLPAAIDPTAVLTTLAHLTARTIADAIRQHAAEAQCVLVCGGGVHNRHLMTLLAREMPGIEVISTARVGLDPDFIEAMAFAWLARQTLAGAPGNRPEVTGADRPVVLGGIYQ